MSNNKLNREIDPFTMVSNSLLNDKEISLSAKGLYAFMRGKPDGWNFTIRSMSKQMKEGQTAIGNYLRELREFGWIDYAKNSDGSGTYSIMASQAFKPSYGNPDQGLCNMQKPSRISNTDLSSNKDVNNTLVDKPTDPSKDDGFNLFWSAGLRKLKRKDTEKIFARIVKDKKTCPVELGQQLHDDIKKRLEYQQFGFAQLHPSTYLNGERWTDEYVDNRQPENNTAKPDNDRWWISDSGIERKAREMGMSPRPTESYRDLADRIRQAIASNQNQPVEPVYNPADDIDDDSIPY